MSVRFSCLKPSLTSAYILEAFFSQFCHVLLDSLHHSSHAVDSKSCKLLAYTQILYCFHLYATTKVLLLFNCSTFHPAHGALLTPMKPWDSFQNSVSQWFPGCCNTGLSFPCLTQCLWGWHCGKVVQVMAYNAGVLHWFVFQLFYFRSVLAWESQRVMAQVLLSVPHRWGTWVGFLGPGFCLAQDWKLSSLFCLCHSTFTNR